MNSNTRCPECSDPFLKWSIECEPEEVPIYEVRCRNCQWRIEGHVVDGDLENGLSGLMEMKGVA